MNKGKGLLEICLLSSMFLLSGCNPKTEKIETPIKGNAVIYTGNQPLFHSYGEKAKTNYLLNNNEFILPNNVFETYAILANKNVKIDSKNEIYGGLIKKNLLLEDSKKDHFITSLISMGYPPEFIIEFYKVLITKGNIIFKEKALQDSSFEELLVHERTHKFTRQLSLSEKNQIQKTHSTLKGKKGPKKPFIHNKEKYNGLITEIINENWEEFFAYLVQGTLEDYVLDSLKINSPRTYEIYLEAKEKTKVCKF